MPKHNHGSASGNKFVVANGNVSVNGNKRVFPSKVNDGVHFVYMSEDTASITEDSTTKVTGSGQSHNNMPPYLTVYMWKRIA